MTPAVYYAMLRTFGTIIKLLGFQWKEHTMKDGRHGYILFFDEKAWMVDKASGEILPRVDESPAD